MELRKNPDIDLERKRGLFFNIGLIVSLSVIITAFQWKFKKTSGIVFDPGIDEEMVHEMEILATNHPVPKRPEPVIIKQPPIFVEKPIEELIEPIEVIEPIEDDIAEIGEGFELPDEKAPEFVDFAEVMPEPAGGMASFYRFLSKNIVYPRRERNMGIQGKVFVQFVVDTDGSISNAHILKGVSHGCDQEALRVLLKTPKWEPGKQGSRPVRVRMVIPITFTLN